jgi:hypothetical protein
LFLVTFFQLFLLRQLVLAAALLHKMKAAAVEHIQRLPGFLAFLLVAQHIATWLLVVRQLAQVAHKIHGSMLTPILLQTTSALQVAFQVQP